MNNSGRWSPLIPSEENVSLITPRVYLKMDMILICFFFNDSKIIPLYQQKWQVLGDLIKAWYPGFIEIITHGSVKR